MGTAECTHGTAPPDMRLTEVNAVEPGHPHPQSVQLRDDQLTGVLCVINTNIPVCKEVWWKGV